MSLLMRTLSDDAEDPENGFHFSNQETSVSIRMFMKSHDSSTKGLDSLHWKSLDVRRKLHRCATICKSKKSDISYTSSNKTGKNPRGVYAIQ